MTDWIYLGSDERFGSIYISPTGSLLKFIIYDPSSKKRQVFTLRDGLGFIYFLKLDNYLKAKKSLVPHLWSYYLELTKRAKRHIGLNDIIKVLCLNYDSLQLLYSKILPIVRARCGNVKFRFRKLFTNNFLKPLGWVRNVHKYFQVVIINARKKDTSQSIIRKCFTIFQQLKDLGMVKPKRIPFDKPDRYGEEFRFTFPCLMDANTFITKYKNIFIKRLEEELRAHFQNYEGYEALIKYYISKVKYALRKNRYIILTTNEEDLEKQFEELLQKVASGEQVEEEPTKILVEFSELKSGDDYYLTVAFNTPIKVIGLYSQIVFFYDRGRIWFNIFEPIDFDTYKVTEYKITKNGKIKIIKTYFEKVTDYFNQLYDLS